MYYSFRIIERYPDYEINQNGDVRRIGSELIRKPYLVNGHPKIVIHGNTEYIGRLVAETYISNPFGFSDVRHIDGDKTNNNVDNLEWASHTRTQKDSYGLGINAPGGDEPPKRVLVVETGVKYSSIRACARDLGIAPIYIRKCLNGRLESYRGWHFTQIL